MLDGRLRAGAGDGWMPQVVLAPPNLTVAVVEAAAVLRVRERRAAVAVVLGVEPGRTATSGLSP